MCASTDFPSQKPVSSLSASLMRKPMTSDACFHDCNATLQIGGAVFVENAQALHKGAAPGPRDGGHGFGGSSSSI